MGSAVCKGIIEWSMFRSEELIVRQLYRARPKGALASWHSSPGPHPLLPGLADAQDCVEESWPGGHRFPIDRSLPVHNWAAHRGDGRWVTT